MDSAFEPWRRLRRLSAAAVLVPALGVSPEVKLVRLSEAPRLENFRAMRPSGALAKVEGFVQRVPKDGASASQKTEVYLGHDGENLHVLFLCFDSEPSGIRARMAPRGAAIESDDRVSIQIDTFADLRRAYSFSANPLGIQSTAMWIEGEGWDDSFDTVWSAEGAITETGYVVLMTIPFRSLRFPPRARQSWGLMLQRNIPRANEESYWPAYSSRVQGRLNQAAVLTGIEDVSPGRNRQLIPHAVVRSTRIGEVADSFDPELGLDAKLVLKDSVVFDATVNPDFSQVEADEPQVTVNQRFEVFFPEKRPFFLENASFFQTPVNLLFTRRIRNPTAGTRLTGKVGPYALGALVSDDDVSSERSLTTALRVSRDVFRQSSVGVLYAERRFGSSDNRAVGVDSRISFDSNWTADLQAVASRTDGIGGAAYEARVNRAGRKLNLELEYRDRSPGFHTETGFEPRSNFRSLKQYATYRFRPEGERLVAFGPDILVRRLTDYEGRELELTYGPAFHWELMRQTSFGVYYLGSRETLRPRDHEALDASARFDASTWGLLFSSAYFPEVTVSGSLAAGRGIHLYPVSGPPDAADRLGGDLGLVLRPMPSLTVDNRYLWTRLESPEDGALVFENHILRSAWNYQVSKPLSVRVIVQYDALRASPARTALESSKNLNADVLLRYFVNHGTALFVGYNGNLRDEDPLAPFVQDSRQVFFKLSYLLRF